MGIGLVGGRDFRFDDTAPAVVDGVPRAGKGIVNEAFARLHFGGQNPVGAVVQVRQDKIDAPMEIVGLVRDAVYVDIREPMRPVVYVPFDLRAPASVLVRTHMDPAALAPVAAAAIARGGTARVQLAAPHRLLVERQTVRERLLAVLSAFFAVVALLLGAGGLWGVLNYTVVQQRQEIGIRMALGARAADVVRRVAGRTLGTASAGTAIGLAAGLAFGRVIDALLFQIKATDVGAIGVPLLTLAAAATLAALPPAMRAARIDPAQTLRTD
jgi:hypothetical protein